MSRYSFDPQLYTTEIYSIIRDIENTPDWGKHSMDKIVKKYPKDKSDIFGRDEILAGYKYLAELDKLEYKAEIHERIKLKPMRTGSGVTPVTVLTKPFPCPGKCIFCPNDVRMPKSYLADEPGAQRAETNHFDPYLQTYNRLLAFQNTGHNTEKVELIILGGTWSFYSEPYQIWFVKRCFEAMNDFNVRDQRADVKTKNIFSLENSPSSKREYPQGEGVENHRPSYNELIAKVAQGDVDEFFSKHEYATWEELFEQQKINQNAKSKCVGLVIETRPDYIDEKEVIKIRKLGATKVQIGIQSLDDEVMNLNKRGHGHKETEEAIRLLRLAGFKIHGHWMPNLYGSSVEKDIEDYKRLWQKEIAPDELKIYPTSIIADTELNDKYQEGVYKPYDYDELLKVLVDTIPTTPRYCRLTRIIRDIPSTDIIAGNKLTNFRQIAEDKITKDGKKCDCIRCREIKTQDIIWEDLELEILEYDSSIGKQIFMSYKTKTSPLLKGDTGGSITHIPYAVKLKENARLLRKNQTQTETILWNKFLRKLEITVNRQKPLLKYIVDFYIATAKLAIEIDGSSHNSNDALDYDNERTKNIESFGIKVLRFTNEQVMVSFDEVCEIITNTISERITPSPSFARGELDTGDKIAGFLRLSLPDPNQHQFIEELKDKAMIREVHVYGQVVGIGKESEGKSQHIGLGTRLLEKACEIAKQNGFDKISVISAIGTREYYRKKGFTMNEGDLYMWREC